MPRPDFEPETSAEALVPPYEDDSAELNPRSIHPPSAAAAPVHDPDSSSDPGDDGEPPAASDYYRSIHTPQSRRRTNFNPDPAELSEVLVEFADADLSLRAIANRHNVTLAAFLAWYSRPEVRRFIASATTAAADHVRLAAINQLPRLINTCTLLIASYERDETRQPFGNDFAAACLRERQRSNARKAVYCLLRLARFFAAPPAPRPPRQPAPDSQPGARRNPAPSPAEPPEPAAAGVDITAADLREALDCLQSALQSDQPPATPDPPAPPPPNLLELRATRAARRETAGNSTESSGRHPAPATNEPAPRAVSGPRPGTSARPAGAQAHPVEPPRAGHQSAASPDHHPP